jgi:16S rRNA (cytidine1402-2'-O)-methyltransferase
MKSGTLYLIPSNLSDPFTPASVLPATVIATAVRLNHYVAENAKAARAFLKRLGIDRPLQEISILELNDQTHASALAEMIAPLLAGHDVGLVSEAGAPGIADPGALIVALAHRHSVPVVPLVGPSAILLGLMAAGLNGQTFAFHGYLPQDKAARVAAIVALERESRQRNMTQLFIETPYRNQAMWSDLIATLAPATQLCIARDLTGSREFVQTKCISDWRKQTPAIEKLPTLFLFMA